MNILNNIEKHIFNNGHRTLFIIVLCFFVVGLFAAKKPAKKRGRAVKTTTDTRVYLDHADELTYDIYGPHRDAQFVKGHVSFQHKGAHLTCDSAYFYQLTNSFQAFGHVKMRQGDTITLTSDYAFYDGNDEMAQARKNVVLTHRKTKLYCDSLNYDRMYNIGYFFEGGKLVDQDNTLISDWGQYNTNDRNAMFYYNVSLKNKKFTITGDTLHYDTRTRRAHMLGPTKVVSSDKSNTIITDDGYYNTNTENAELYGRSTVHNRDGKVITADSLYHNSKTGESEGFRNVVYTDTLNKNILTADYFRYNENTGEGFATNNPVARDYSQGDTLYVHADTMRIETFNIDTDSVYRKIHAYPHMRAFRTDIQAVADSLVMSSLDSCLTMYKDPVCWNYGRQLLGEKIEVFMGDSTIRYAHVDRQALSVEHLEKEDRYNQVASNEMKSWFVDGKLRLNQAEKNVLVIYFPIDDSDSTLIGMNYTETDTMRMYLSPERQLERIWMPKHSGTMYPISQIPTGKDKLPSFVWLDYMRPLHKDDIFEWRPKNEASKLKEIKRREAPKQKVNATKPQETVEQSDD